DVCLHRIAARSYCAHRESGVLRNATSVALLLGSRERLLLSHWASVAKSGSIPHWNDRCGLLVKRTRSLCPPTAHAGSGPGAPRSPVWGALSIPAAHASGDSQCDESHIGRVRRSLIRLRSCLSRTGPIIASPRTPLAPNGS